MVFEKVREILASYKDIDKEEISLETELAELNIDSLDVVELIMQLEQEFDITIKFDDDIKTVGSIVEKIQALV
jgi:Acyl carrier protein